MSASNSLARNASEPSHHTLSPLVSEPSYVDAFYRPSGRDYSGSWHNGTRGSEVGSVPKISDVLAARPAIRRPVRPIQTTAKCVLGKQVEQEKKATEVDKILSADIVPKKFPVPADRCAYPASGKKGASNPLYYTSSTAYGSEMPMAHQVPDRYFPSTNKFSKQFTDVKPRYTGLSTAPTPSRIHPALDEHY